VGSGIGVPGMSYVFRFLVLGLALPLVIWLLFNGPDLKASANLFFFGIIVLKFYWLIWGRVLFAMFGGDRFTYGGLALGLNIYAFAQALVWGVFYFTISPWLTGGPRWQHLSQVPTWLVGYLSIWMLLNMAIPLMTSRHVSPLPKASERRTFETPGEDMPEKGQ
jgi:hypothetical protein